MTSIPDKLKNFMVYDESRKLIGIADVVLPDLAYMTEAIQGAGILGPVDTPAVGHFQSMTATLNWRAVFEENVIFLAPKRYHLVFRGSVQHYDDSLGELPSQGVEVVTRVLPKNVNLGNMGVAITMGTAGTFEVMYIKVSVEGKELVEIDKMNHKFVVNGVDYLAKTRRDLGMA